MKKVIIIAVVCFSLSNPLEVFSFGKKEAPVNVLQERYDSLTVPGIIMLPVKGTAAVSQNLLVQIDTEINKQLTEIGRIKPVRMQRWLLANYTNKVNNPFVVMNQIRSEQFLFPMSHIGRPVVFRTGNQHYFAFYVYPLETYYPIVILRHISSLSSIEPMIASCLEELNIRLSQPPVSRDIRKRVIVDDFKLEFLSLVRLQSGEFDFIPVPFLELEKVPLREGDDFFSRIMGYILITTNLFQTIQIGDFSEYSNTVINPGTAPADYRIRGRVQLTERECVLSVDLIEIRSSAVILSLRYPLTSYSFENIWSAYQWFSLQIVEKIFDDEVYGVVPDISLPGRYFFANNMYIGRNKLENLVLPRGMHVISTGNANRIEPRSSSVNTYHVLLDNRSFVFTNAEGRHIWNLLSK